MHNGSLVTTGENGHRLQTGRQSGWFHGKTESIGELSGCLRQVSEIVCHKRVESLNMSQLVCDHLRGLTNKLLTTTADNDHKREKTLLLT